MKADKYLVMNAKKVTEKKEISEKETGIVLSSNYYNCSAFPILLNHHSKLRAKVSDTAPSEEK